MKLVELGLSRSKVGWVCVNRADTNKPIELSNTNQLGWAKCGPSRGLGPGAASKVSRVHNLGDCY